MAQTSRQLEGFVGLDYVKIRPGHGLELQTGGDAASRYLDMYCTCGKQHRFRFRFGVTRQEIVKMVVETYERIHQEPAGDELDCYRVAGWIDA